MILKIHLLISMSAYIFFWLTIYRMIHIYKKENKDKKIKNNKLGFINNLRLVILFLIPVSNIVMLMFYIYIFCFKNDEDFLKIIAKYI